MSAAEPDWLTAMRNTIALRDDDRTWVAQFTGDPHGDSGQWDVWPYGEDLTAICCLGDDEASQEDAAHIAAWCPDSARRLLAAHDQLRADADRMAEALGLVTEEHTSTGGPCVYCKGSDWVEDEGWQPDFPGETRVDYGRHAGYLPCPAHDPGAGTLPECQECGDVWPCTHAQAAEALRAYQEHQA